MIKRLIARRHFLSGFFASITAWLIPGRAVAHKPQKNVAEFTVDGFHVRVEGKVD